MEYMTADTKVNGYMVYPRFLSTIDVSQQRKLFTFTCSIVQGRHRGQAEAESLLTN